MSDTYPPTLKTVTIESRDKFVIVTLNRPPVNGMNLDVWSDLLAALDATEKQTKIRGIIFTSGLQKGEGREERHMDGVGWVWCMTGRLTSSGF